MYEDVSVYEAVSWRLASELMRRHPDEARLFRGHPGGGTYDLLWIKGLRESNLDIRLNRRGTIQVHGRADAERFIDWKPTPWVDYLAADPKSFLERLERASGLTVPHQVPSSTPTTLTYRVLAALTSFGLKTIHPIVIEEGFIDSSGEHGGHNFLMDQFTFPAELTRPREDDLFGIPGYRFWIPTRDSKPLCAIEQTSATVWFSNTSTSLDLMSMYRSNHKEIPVVAAMLLAESRSREL